MRKLVFMYKVNSAGSSLTPKNLEISTHKGARLTIRGNIPTVLDVTKDEMSDIELQDWYRSRYSGMGLGIKILDDSVAEVIPVSQSIHNVNVVETSEIVVQESEVVLQVQEPEVLSPSSNLDSPQSLPNTEEPVEVRTSKVEPKPVEADMDFSNLQSYLW